MSQCCNYAVGDRHTKTVTGVLDPSLAVSPRTLVKADEPAE